MVASYNVPTNKKAKHVPRYKRKIFFVSFLYIGI